MNEALVTKWIKALENGRYRQGFGRLSDIKGDKEYNCCLGVLCRVARIPLVKWSTFRVIPQHLQERLGISSGDGGYGGHCHDTLAYANDIGRKSFRDIAAIIKRNWREL